MALSTAAITRRTRKAMQHAGYTVTIGGTAYDCFPVSMRDRELQNRSQTFREHYHYSLGIIAADVAVAIGDTVTYGGTTERVLDIGTTADGLQDVLHLGKRYGA